MKSSKRHVILLSLIFLLECSARAHAQLSYIHTCASHMEEITGKFLYMYIKVALCYKSIRVDVRDLSRMVSGLTSLSLTAWRQVSETWLQKRPPGRNLGEHRLVQRSGATSRCTVFSFFFLW